MLGTTEAYNASTADFCSITAFATGNEFAAVVLATNEIAVKLKSPITNSAATTQFGMAAQTTFSALESNFSSATT